MRRADVISGVVLDASVATTWSLRDETSTQGLELLTLDTEQHGRVPPIFFTEVANALLAAERRGRISRADLDGSLHDLMMLDLRVTAPSLELSIDALKLARAYALTVYDAAYLQVALETGLPLATFDRQLVTAARMAGVLLA